jgi:hypothetical protein
MNWCERGRTEVWTRLVGQQWSPTVTLGIRQQIVVKLTLLTENLYISLFLKKYRNN